MLNHSCWANGAAIMAALPIEGIFVPFLLSAVTMRRPIGAGSTAMPIKNLRSPPFLQH
ncbi:Hypothetical protein ETEE_0164 [Edwardsiella anguillarum ET080813]|uniref:Uncharacterized protein n=1 Tax=Edwardsiella anguillarum ET080813 TaxID=667120 RepID=A0A076LJA5_9GAMM|nr:Hypothetical protein ETEE_0164 [Edwardsiella anguillarum ET080813]